MTNTILIVEDNDDSRMMLAVLLKVNNYNVIEAGDGYEAVKIGRQSRPDLIIMDMSMPLMDGIFATQLLKSYEETKNIPVISLTAYDRYYHRKSLEVGCEEVLSKPIEPPVLLEVISRYLN